MLAKCIVQSSFPRISMIFRMTRLTSGVSVSSFAANLGMRQNTLDHQKGYPQAVKAVIELFYVDVTLTGAASIKDAIELQAQLQELLDRRGFILQKRK